MHINVTPVFEQFATKVNGKVKMFDTEAEATAAAILAENEAEFNDLAVAYTKSLEDTTPKQRKQQENVIISFLAWQAGREDEVETVESVETEETIG